jgi:hypothetical protein
MSRCGGVALCWGASPARRCLVRSVHRPMGTLAVIALALVAVFALVFAPTAGATPTQFGSYGQGAGQFEDARGAAVEQDSGDVYIADRDNSRVEEWSKEGVFVRAWDSGFSRPSGVAVDNNSLTGFSHGDVYVVDTDNNRVQKFGPDGEFKLMFGGEVNETKDGEAGASEAEKDLCTQEEIESGVKCKAGVEGPGNGEFVGLGNQQLAPIAVDAEGHVYVGDANRVQRFSEGGVYEPTVLAGVGGVEALAAAPGGDIYVLSSGSVREYDSGGVEVAPVVPARDETGHPLAIAAGPGGSLFVDDEDEPEMPHSIRVYDAAGEEVQVFDEGEEKGEFGIAWGEGAAALYVVGAVRVRVVPQPPPGPVVRPGSELASEVDPTTAVLHASVNPEVNPKGQEVEYLFEYGTSACTPGSCGSATKKDTLEPSFEGDAVEAPLSGLKPKTTYHFRIVATDSEGHRTVGPEASFTTPPAVQIEETSVSDVAATSATFSAELDPLGVAASWRIEYAGEAAKLGTSAAAIAGEGTLAAGSEPVAVSAHVQTGLSAATSSHYRVVAEDEREGVPYTVEGPDETFMTQGEGETLGVGGLPDHRTWELVSPPARHGAPIKPIGEYAPVQAAAGGGAIAYATVGAIEAAAEGNRALEASTVISTHGAAGWSSRDLATANENVTEGYKVGYGNEYRLFSPDLSTALVEPQGTTPLPPLSPTAEQTLYVRQGDGSFEALVTTANVEPGAHFGGALTFLGATPDLAHVVFESSVSLMHSAGAGLYEWSAGRLQFVGSGSLGSALNGGTANRRGAVASEGTRVFYSGEEHLYMFDTETEKAVQLDAVQGGTGQGEARPFYQDASVEGTRAFFTDAQDLTPGASAGSLYEYEAQTGELSDLTVPVNAGESAAVQGLLPGVSEDGSYVYVVAGGVLTTSANGYGETATAGADNLYELHLHGESWQPTFVATLGSDSPDWGGTNSKLVDLTARSSTDGRYLAFMSDRSLTGYDNTDVNETSGKHADEEVYLYDAKSAKLVCASCDPSGARPTGIDDAEEHRPLVDEEKVWAGGTWLAASVPGWTPIKIGEAMYQSRYLDDAGRLFFDSPDALVPQAVNHTEDVYQYEPSGEGSCSEASTTYGAASAGCVSLISSATSGEESAFLDASESGDDVFFLSEARLTPQASASGYDVYDAHVCGAGWACETPQPVASPPCTIAELCRAAPAAQPSLYGAPSSATFSGAGNLAPAKTSTPKPKTSTRAQKLAAALKACKRDKEKTKRQKCEKVARARYGAKAKKAGNDRRTDR